MTSLANRDTAELVQHFPRVLNRDWVLVLKPRNPLRRPFHRQKSLVIANTNPNRGSGRIQISLLDSLGFMDIGAPGGAPYQEFPLDFNHDGV